MSGLGDKVGSDFVAKSAEHSGTGVNLQSAHPAPFVVAKAVENGIDGDAARVTANNKCANQPWQINDRANGEHD